MSEKTLNLMVRNTLSIKCFTSIESTSTVHYFYIKKIIRNKIPVKFYIVLLLIKAHSIYFVYLVTTQLYANSAYFAENLIGYLIY